MGIEVEQAQGIDTVDPRARLVPVRPVFRELWVVAPGYEVVSVDYSMSRRRREALHAWASFDVGGDVEIRPMVAGPGGRLCDAFQVYAEASNSALVGVYREGQQPSDFEIDEAARSIPRKWKL